MFKLASLFVEIKAQDSALQQQIGGVQKQLSAFGVAIGTAAGNLAATAISSGLSAVTSFFTKGIVGAANMGESISKVQAVFGEAAGTITGVADELAAKFGLPKQAILDAGAAIGLVGKAAGQSQSAAAEMGAKMAKLAADASSFYNVPLEEALGKIRSGLVGESEPLRAFGVLLSEEAVAAEAVALGLAKSAKEVDQQSKVMARASLITKGLGDATGDLERTSGSTANQWRKFTGTLENLAVSIGESLSPAVSEIISLANEMGQSLVTGIEASKGAFSSFASGVAEAARTIGVAWRSLPDLWDITVIKATEMGTNLMRIVGVLPENFSRIAAFIGKNWKELILDGINATVTAFQNLATNLGNLTSAIIEWFQNPTKGFSFEWKPLLEGFKATAEEFPELLAPELVSMQDQIDAVGQRVADKEAKRAADLAAKQAGIAAAGKKTAEQAAGKTKEFKSETMDVADFTMKLRASIFGGDDTAKQQLEQQKQIAQNTKKMSDKEYNKLIAVLG